MLSRAFYDRYGLYPPGSETLEHIEDLLHEVPEIGTSGEWFAKRVRHDFDIARNHFTCSKLEGGPAVLDRRFTGAVHRCEERAAVRQGAAA